MKMFTPEKLCHQKKSEDHQTRVAIGSSVLVGGSDIVVVAGPCAVESEDQMTQIAQTLTRLNIRCLRGGIFKPRSSPYSFQGLGESGLALFSRIKEKYALAIITEVMSEAQIEPLSLVVDCFQVGSRNMQNFELLKALGKTQKPILLKRGMAATLEEFLLAAEYILAAGNPNVILCERGIRSFDPMTRNVLDLGAVALLKQMTHLPVLVDPSHATGQRSLIAPTAKAAIAVGADGLLIETHPNPDQSVSDAAQTISLEDLSILMPELEAIAHAVGRSLVCDTSPASRNVSMLNTQMAVGLPCS